MWLLLSLVILLGGGLRTWGVDKVPPELFGDELDVGYQAYSLLHTGKDILGQAIPAYIHSLSEWRAPLLMYATVPSVATLGLNEWGVRTPEIVFGILTIPILFLLTYHTTRSKAISLFTCLALVFTPWHIYYSRAAFEAVLMIDLILLATLLFLKRRFILASLLFALSMYTYSTAVLFVPLWLVILWRLTKNWPGWKVVLLFSLVLAPLTYHVIAGPARDRFGSLSITHDEEAMKEMLAKRAQDPSLLGRVFNNRYEVILNLFLKNYLHSFSTVFLFIKGDPIYRHSIQTTGQLLPVLFPFVIIGLFGLAKKKHWVWWWWMALAPIPASLTVDGGYHATRLFLLMPPLIVAAGAGLTQVWELRKWLGVLALLAIVAVFTQNAYVYAVYYRANSWRWWHVGYESAIKKLAVLAPGYDRVFINNTYEPALIRFLFWSGYPPDKFHSQFTSDQSQVDIMPNFDGFTLDGKYFLGKFNQKDWIRFIQPGSLYLISQRDDVGGDWDWRKTPPDEIKVLHTAVNLYDEPILYLVTRR